MTALPTAPAATAKPANDIPASRTPILITEHEIAFNTAAATPTAAPPTTRGAIDAFRVTVSALRRIQPRRRLVRPDRPARYPYLQDARMAREMDRL